MKEIWSLILFPVQEYLNLWDFLLRKTRVLWIFDIPNESLQITSDLMLMTQANVGCLGSLWRGLATRKAM